MYFRRSELRRGGKWVGLAAVAVIVAADVLSVWWGVGLDKQVVDFDRSAHMGVYCGRINAWWKSPGRPGTFAGYGPNPVGPDMHFRWDFSWQEIDNGSGTRSTTHAGVPLWFVGAIAAAITAWLWWLDRPSRFVRFCRMCGYDRGGLEGQPCPECGYGRMKKQEAEVAGSV